VLNSLPEPWFLAAGTVPRSSEAVYRRPMSPIVSLLTCTGYYDYRCVLKFIFAKHYSVSSLFFIDTAVKTVIKFRGAKSRNRAHKLVTGDPKSHVYSSWAPISHFNHWALYEISLGLSVSL